jgi:hypothetical protein
MKRKGSKVFPFPVTSEQFEELKIYFAHGSRSVRFRTKLYRELLGTNRAKMLESITYKGHKVEAVRIP